MAHGMVITPPCGFFFFDRSFDSSIRLCLQDWMPSLMGGTSGGFRQPTNGTASAVAGSSAAWACLLLLGLIFAGVVGLIFVGARISASPPRSLAAGPATPAFTILAVGGDAWRVDARRVDARRVDAAFRRVVLLPASGAASAQLPPRDVAVSSFRCAARLPARSSLRRAAASAST